MIGWGKRRMFRSGYTLVRGDDFMLLEKTRTFVYRHARPLDLARWQFHFEGGSREAVLTALAVYQNEDGGFGHALEADCWNPDSSPLQTWAATEILRELGGVDKGHSIAAGILRYLESGARFNGAVWANTIPSNNDFPHAPWWHHSDSGSSLTAYNPTASLAGFILAYADPNSALYTLGMRLCREAITHFLQEEQEEMHTVACYVRLWEYGRAAGFPDGAEWAALEEKLQGQVPLNVESDPSKWATGYVCRPSHYLNSPTSAFYAGIRDLADEECRVIRSTQLEDGSWPITWNWGAYPEEWPVSRNWWKSVKAIEHAMYLRNFASL